MIYLSRLFLWLCLAFTVSNQQLLPRGGYQHEIVFPSLRGELHTSTGNVHQPIRQMSAGFHLNPPPPLPFLQSFPLNPFLFSGGGNVWNSENSQGGRFLSPPFLNLFTPNTVKNQRPQSEAQDEAYRDSLKEEEEATEKETYGNDITTDFENFDTEATSIGPNSKTFVRLHVQGKDYSYST